MTSIMEKSSHDSKTHDEAEFNLKEWGLKARISRENTSSRRFSASNLRSFREDTTSFRSNITISSTASSPGYTLREEIDPSTYSFTTALKALQAKTIYTWEYLSPDHGYTLNSKWNDAEKYISNPLSGEVPLECLSAKTLSGRSFRSLTSRITMSAPLIYPSYLHQFSTKPTITQHEIENDKKVYIQEKVQTIIKTRDIGTQSTPADLSSTSPSPVPTPSIEERSIKHSETECWGDYSSVSTGQLTLEKEVGVKETRENQLKEEGERKKGRKHMVCSGCLSFKSLWMRKRSATTQKPTKNNAFIYHINAC